MYENRLGGRAHGGFGGEQLGDGGGLGRGQAVVHGPGGAVDQKAGGLHIGGHVRQGRAYLLKVGDALAELEALLREGDASVQAGLCHANSARSHSQAAPVEGGHGDLETLPGRAEHGALWHATIL